jgi:hypothetical protein
MACQGFDVDERTEGHRDIVTSHGAPRPRC